MGIFVLLFLISSCFNNKSDRNNSTIPSTELSGTIASIRKIESSKIYYFDGENTRFIEFDSNGKYFINGYATYGHTVMLISISDNLNSDNVEYVTQARIIPLEIPDDNSIGKRDGKEYYPKLSLSIINPLSTARVLSICDAHDLDLYLFAKDVAHNTMTPESEKKITTIMRQIEFEFYWVNSLVASWGVDSSGQNIFKEINSKIDYRPRSNFTEDASFSALFIEILGVRFGSKNLPRALLNHIEENKSLNVNLLTEKGFQEGLVLVLYSLNKYQPSKAVNVNLLLKEYLENSDNLTKYESTLQKIVDDLLKEEEGLSKTEEEILAKIKTILADQDISFP